MFSDNGPNEFEVDAEVLMNYNVTECDDLWPGNLRVRFSKLVRHATARLPE